MKQVLAFPNPIKVLNLLKITGMAKMYQGTHGHMKILWLTSAPVQYSLHVLPVCSTEIGFIKLIMSVK